MTLLLFMLWCALVVVAGMATMAAILLVVIVAVAIYALVIGAPLHDG
jgi:hypothetical protein